jgi:hypothetical protein
MKLFVSPKNIYTPSTNYREWDESGQLWVQKVSSTPATRLDVINLQVNNITISVLVLCTFGQNTRNEMIPSMQVDETETNFYVFGVFVL